MVVLISAVGMMMAAISLMLLAMIHGSLKTLAAVAEERLTRTNKNAPKGIDDHAVAEPRIDLGLPVWKSIPGIFRTLAVTSLVVYALGFLALLVFEVSQFQSGPRLDTGWYSSGCWAIAATALGCQIVLAVILGMVVSAIAKVSADY
jgi:hypothetical protein